jgi:hypothetical protein
MPEFPHATRQGEKFTLIEGRKSQKEAEAGIERRRGAGEPAPLLLSIPWRRLGVLSPMKAGSKNAAFDDEGGRVSRCR